MSRNSPPPPKQTEEEQRAPPSTTTPAYSAFSRHQKNTILALAASAGWFSSISSFIYFPAIPVLAADLDVSVEKIKLTVTSYLIKSGIFPAIMGDAADRFGRRPVLLLGLFVYLCANVGLALQSNFGLLFFFRMVQSAGVSGTYSIAYGVLGDLFTPAERGEYSGIMSFFLNTSPSIGPVLSGLLLLRWSWRSIFWFLSAATPCCLVPMILFLPETARNIVQDGTVTAKGFNRPLISALVPQVSFSRCPEVLVEPVKKKHRHFPNAIASLKLVRIPNTAIILLAYGVNYATYTCLQASLSTIFLEVYGITGVAAGLIYLPFGCACAIAAFATGTLLDCNYRRTATEAGIAVDKRKIGDLLKFPIERARTRTIKLFVALSAALIVGYGWQLNTKTSMAGPLVEQFFIGLTIQSLFTALNTLIVDIHQNCPYTAQAACNFVRCEMAAADLAALDPLLRSLGPGWSFVILAALVFFLVPLLLLLEWRALKRSWVLACTV
ncbi:major facilitator superfamily domain-containing protein [Pseudomassariella vexata]|uniref:Major facilitator superfamily domain-containing protein n=1 Tax=Pseudomassariella vexata TaxID=1141098 RepID=A0A1Y2DQW6_9PEZI|nr:major facilitator superfamily domain-containing protein [Pseudomassariella vexata]ORY61678.1 major facilitator superfamily domain-containing protein [Pseudomassariella vexata]